MSLHKRKDISDYQCQSERQNESSFQNSLCVKREKKLKLKLKKQRIYKQKRHGSWTREQQQKFIEFMKLHIDVFQCKNLRRSNKIFRKMSRFIKTRSSEQCRSHHQKYQIRFENPMIIISHIQEKIKENAYNIQPHSKQESMVISNIKNKSNTDLQNNKGNYVKIQCEQNIQQSGKLQRIKKEEGKTSFSQSFVVQESKGNYRITLNQPTDQLGIQIRIEINFDEFLTNV